MRPVWRRWYQAWLARRVPPARDVVLSQRRIFIFPTRYGFFFLLLALLLFVGGINYQNNLVMGFSFLLFSLFCIAIWDTFRNLAGLRIRVAGMVPDFAGNSGKLRLHLSAVHAHASIRLYWQAEAAESLSLNAGEEAWLELAVPLARRGYNRPSRLTVESRYPLGLLRTWSLPDMDCACLAWPVPLPGGECPASGSDDDQGQQESGQGSDDFAGLRDYLPGDSLHLIDWKAYARGLGLNVRQFSDPAEGRQWLEWDRLAGMSVEQRLSRLCYWAQQLEAAGSPWGLILPQAQLLPGKGRAHLEQALTLLGEFGEVPP